MVILPNGNVGIDTDPPVGQSNYKLYVGTGIMTREVKLYAGVWEDQVFAAGYPLLPLQDLNQYLGKNKHLPGIPSEAEILKNEGFEVGDMQKRMLKKIEELTLYILEQQKNMDTLNARLELLEKHAH
jgi:hypothetical protein